MKKEECIEKLKTLVNIRKTIRGKIKGEDIREIKGEIIDEVSHIVGENKYVIQKVKLIKDGIGFRIGYYTCDAKYTKLYYGGYSPIMKESDFLILQKKAKKKGWI